MSFALKVLQKFHLKKENVITQECSHLRVHLVGTITKLLLVTRLYTDCRSSLDTLGQFLNDPQLYNISDLSAMSGLVQKQISEDELNEKKLSTNKDAGKCEKLTEEVYNRIPSIDSERSVM